MAKNLWKGKRGAQDDVHRNEEETFPSVQADDVQAHYVSVGETLRNRREERGEDLRYVAQILRIRYPYLKAIEDGHPDELPGPTYAVGFVRTYADHLDLPSEELVQQFKEEAANLQARADLHFPAPIPEGKIPSGAVLVIAVVLAAAVYAGWIYLSSQEQQVAEIVPQLPNRISEIIKGDPNKDDSKTAEKSDTAAMPAEVPQEKMTSAATPTSPMPVEDKTAMASDTPAPTAAQSSPEPESAVSPAPEQTSESDSSGGAAAEPAQDAVAAVQPETRSEEAIPAPPGSETGSSETEDSPTPPETASESNVTESASVEPEPATEPSDEADRAPPKTYGEENGNARIVIHAAADSWVEVRDSATDELLLTRVLFKGDKYLVPDREGLTLLTGNAGGLRIVVDGSNVPPIGPLGAVRRNVVLEPTPLLSGNAARRTDGGSIRTDSQTSEGDFQSQ